MKKNENGTLSISTSTLRYLVVIAVVISIVVLLQPFMVGRSIQGNERRREEVLTTQAELLRTQEGQKQQKIDECIRKGYPAYQEGLLAMEKQFEKEKKEIEKSSMPTFAKNEALGVITDVFLIEGKEKVQKTYNNYVDNCIARHK